MPPITLRNSFIAVVTAGLAAALTACGGSGSPSAPPAPPASASGASTAVPATGTTVEATLGVDANAFIYDPSIIPAGSHVKVVESVQGQSTTVSLDVHGLLPNRVYGAHVHKMVCGPVGDDAGAHFQHTPDPKKPSIDPMFANPHNEVWLDVSTDAHGDATSTSTVPWTFPEPAGPGSVVIHAEKTQTAPGKAGTAGARAACISAKF